MPTESRIAAPAPPVTVELWMVDVNAPGQSEAAATNVLSEGELARAAGFRNATARRSFLFARAALRQILGERLRAPASALTFSCGPHGKPELTGQFAGQLHFNLSHSGEVAVVAICADAELGVDVEQLRELPDAVRLAERFFKPAESAGLAALPAAEQTAAIFNLWTCKEALAKAIGQPILLSLGRFELTSGATPRLKAMDGDFALAREWTLHTFTPKPGYIATVALPCPTARFALRHFGAQP